MTGKSDDARTPEDEQARVDSAWDELLDGAEKAESPDSSATEDRSHPGGHNVVGKDRVADPEREMDRLMFGAPPPLSNEGAEKKATSTNVIFDAADDAKDDADQETNDAKADDADQDAGDEQTDTADEEASRKNADDATEEADAKDEGSKSNRRPALRVVSDDEGRDEDEAPKASRPIETFAETPAANDTGGPPWGWIGIGVLAVGAAIAFAMGGDEPTKPGPKPAATASVESPRAAAPTPNEPVPTPTEPTPTEPTPAGDESTAGEPPESGTSSGDSEANGQPLGDQPRVVPPGTTPEAAAAFLRLPVSPSDRPPVGGVGAKGIHIDHIAMGSQVVGGTCKGRSDGFSVSRREVASVCVRVVHQRTKEELQLLWQKHGGSTRRSKIVVQPKHAYRTRGHLKLREEYIGDWTVRILSSDDVELARHDFTVAP